MNTNDDDDDEECLLRLNSYVTWLPHKIDCVERRLLTNDEKMLQLPTFNCTITFYKHHEYLPTIKWQLTIISASSSAKVFLACTQPRFQYLWCTSRTPRTGRQCEPLTACFPRAFSLNTHKRKWNERRKYPRTRNMLLMRSGINYGNIRATFLCMCVLSEKALFSSVVSLQCTWTSVAYLPIYIVFLLTEWQAIEPSSDLSMFWKQFPKFAQWTM